MMKYRKGRAGEDEKIKTKEEHGIPKVRSFKKESLIYNLKYSNKVQYDKC